MGHGRCGPGGHPAASPTVRSDHEDPHGPQGRPSARSGLARDDLIFLTRRTGRPLQQRNVARAVADTAKAAGLGKLGSHDLRRSFCSLAGRRGVDPIEAAQITGHSPDVWVRFYARSYGKEQRSEARRRMLEHGFGAAEEDAEAVEA